MRDRSSLNPELVVFPSDERTLEQRYEDCRLERDELEVQVRNLSTLIIDLLSGRKSHIEILAAMSTPRPPTAQLKGAQTRRLHQSTPVVYYLRRDAETVKIGYSQSIIARLDAFHAQHSDLLAVEIGGKLEERARHSQFAADRIDKTELFRLSEPLRAHIEDLQRKNPDPLAMATRLNGLAA